jgi:hypothetical protein
MDENGASFVASPAEAEIRFETAELYHRRLLTKRSVDGHTVPLACAAVWNASISREGEPLQRFWLQKQRRQRQALPFREEMDQTAPQWPRTAAKWAVFRQ